jgi:hypothetical protein
MPHSSSKYIDIYLIKLINICISGVLFQNIHILNTIRLQKPQKQATLFAICLIYFIDVPINPIMSNKYIGKASPLGLKYSGKTPHFNYPRVGNWGPRHEQCF